MGFLWTWSVWFGIWICLVTLVQGQDPAQGRYTVPKPFPADPICGKAFGDANSTWVYSTVNNTLSSQGLQKDQAADNTTLPGWPSFSKVAATMNSPDGQQDVYSTLWYSNPADYSDDFRLRYDACEMQLDKTTITNNTYLLAIKDGGTCGWALGTQCEYDLEDAAINITLALVSNPTPPPNSNLTAASLPNVCFSIQTALNNMPVPASCTSAFLDPPKMNWRNAAPLTSFNSSYPNLYSNCSITDNGSTYYPIATRKETDFSNHTQYKSDMYDPWMSMFIFMSVANGNRETTSNDAVSATMSCLAPSVLVAGSLAVDAPPDGTPVPASSTNTTKPATGPSNSASSAASKLGLSKAATAGVAVGASVGGLALLAGLGFAAMACMKRRRRQQYAPAKSSEDDESGHMSEIQDQARAAMNGTGAYQKRYSELPPSEPQYSPRFSAVSPNMSHVSPAMETTQGVYSELPPESEHRPEYMAYRPGMPRESGSLHIPSRDWAPTPMPVPEQFGPPVELPAVVEHPTEESTVGKNLGMDRPVENNVQKDVAERAAEEAVGEQSHPRSLVVENPVLKNAAVNKPAGKSEDIIDLHGRTESVN